MAGDSTLDRFLQHWKQNRDDTRLFQHLADVHDLDRGQRELLASIAEREDVVRVSEMFVRPTLVDGTPDAERWHRKEIAALRERLFGGPRPRKRGAPAHG